MQYLLLVYIDPELLAQMPEEEFNTEMRECLQQADGLAAGGTLMAAQQLEPVKAAKTVRSRAGKMQVLDGPFAETKEYLAGFNLIEAASLDEAVNLAREFPWTRYGSVEVRPVLDMAVMRERVGA
jgi:hypothetical protein